MNNTTEEQPRHEERDLNLFLHEEMGGFVGGIISDDAIFPTEKALDFINRVLEVHRKELAQAKKEAIEGVLDRLEKDAHIHSSYEGTYAKIIVKEIQKLRAELTNQEDK